MMQRKVVVLIVVGFGFCGLWIITQAWPLPPMNVGSVRPGYTEPYLKPLSGFDDLRLKRSPDETELGYVRRVKSVIFGSTYNCNYNRFDQSWLAALAIRFSNAFPSDNGILTPAVYRCGFCHQTAFILAETLRRNGISTAYVLGLDGHVVTAFSIGGVAYAVDADYGVGPFATPWNDHSQLLENVTAAYRDVFLSRNDYLYKTIINAYVTTKNNASYYDMKYLERSAAAQERILVWQKPIEWGLLIVGLSCLIAAAVTMCRSNLGRRR